MEKLSKAERRAELLRMRDERLGDIKKRFEEAQKRNFNSNFAPGGKDADLVRKNINGVKRGKGSRPQVGNFKGATQAGNSKNTAQTGGARSGAQAGKAKNTPRAGKTNKYASGSKVGKTTKTVDLAVSTRKGEMVHHQRMLSADVNAQATQHIVGIPVNKSRYNGYKGEQLTAQQIKRARPTPDAVRIIPFGGVGEFGIGKNMTIIEYGSEIIVIDMGTLFASDDYPGVNYLIPDIKYLEDNIKHVKAICFTHAHLDHIGACRHLLPKFGTHVPIYATEFTLGMIKKQMDELNDPPEMNYQAVNPLEHRVIQVSEHLSVEFIHTLHSIPGNAAIVVRTPNGPIYVSGDWRAESKPMGIQTDFARIDEIAKTEGFALMLNESTNIDSPGHHPHSEYDVGENIGRVMDNYANGRVIVSCFSSQIGRIELILNEAAKRGRKVALAGFSMINNLEVALRAGVIKVPKNTIMKMEDIIKLPDEQVTIVCTGSQGEINAVLNRMVTGAHRHIKIKSSDTIVFSSNPIPGNEPHVFSTVDGLLREGAGVIQNGKSHLTNLGPLHLSGHAYYEDHVEFVSRLKPLNYMPYHGEFYMLEHNCEMAENVLGMPLERIILPDDGDIIELLPDKTIQKNGRIQVGNQLFDDADKPVHEAVVKDRIHISREGIFIVVLTVAKKNGRLVKTPDIISRAFVYLDNSEELIGKIRHYLRAKTDAAAGFASDDDEAAAKAFKEEVREEVTRILFDATGHTPIVIPVINKV